VWRRLKHRNVLPLLGVASDFGPYTSMVCPWVTNGTLNTYLERFRTTLTMSNKFTLVNRFASFHLLCPLIIAQSDQPDN
jgi:hypothetical protein